MQGGSQILRGACPSMSCPDLVSTIAGPDSVRTVAQHLCREGRLTLKDLQTQSGLARRTVYGALRRLRDMGLVREAPNLRDTRQHWYALRMP